MHHRAIGIFLALPFVLGLSGSLKAQTNDPALEQKARGVLSSHCFKCHSHAAGKAKGDLMLDTRSAMLKGGFGGTSLVPGHPEKSSLIRSVLHTDPDLKMPRGAAKLSAKDIDVLVRWVQAGAPWADEPAKSGLRIPGKITEADRRYWAFQPIRPVKPQALEEPNPIDYFVRARLRNEGIAPAPQADPRTLIRRISFNLIGLPPTAEEVEDFTREWNQAQGGVGDPRRARDAMSRLVDRLLASPHYGERWARHWLDVVRFAESDGYRLDSFRPHAWRYRDYVIKSFNDDKPYDRFLREQIAGDELYPDDLDAQVAVGFLTHGIYEFNQRNVRGQWAEMIHEVADVTGEAILGLSMGCARCHDHKFDPILQKDYFAWKSFFDGLMPSEDLPYASARQKADHARKLAEWAARTASIRQQIEAIEGPVRAKDAATAISKFPPDIQVMLNKAPDQRTPLERQLATLAHRQILFEYVKLDTKIKGPAKDRLLALRKELSGFQKEYPAALSLSQGVREVGKEPPPTLLPRTNSRVAPAFLEVLGQVVPKIAPTKTTSGRRSVLANWLTRPENPLVSRVLVNRVWQQHFGRGLVATASDFGNLGEKPSHPDLLDWLADRFIKDGWSLKKLHRLIVTSKTYQQSSLSPPDAVGLRKDPDNRLLWKMTTRRLDAEQIRDAMLLTTGQLNRTVGGPSVDFKEPRRSVYLKWLRNTKEPLLEIFDLPDGFTSSGRRNVSTTSTQALFMLNSPFMLGQGRVFAQRVLREDSADEDTKIEAAFRLAFSRSASSKEIQLARMFLSEQVKRIPSQKGIPSSLEVGTIPFHAGKAAVITPDGIQARFQIPAKAIAPTDTLTLEAFVYLRSVFADRQVRTIAANWDGNAQGNGWVLGVTGKKSAYKPQSLVLQLWGQDAKGKPAYEAIFSGLHLQLNRPYFVAVAINLQDPSDKGLTFYLKDLANDEEPLGIYSTTHKVMKANGNRGPFTIGGTSGKLERSWDGLIDDVRISSEVLQPNQLLFAKDGLTKSTIAYWRFEPGPGMLRDSSPNGLTLERVRSTKSPPAVARPGPRQAAWIDFCQVLLNANEFLYVD